MGKENKKEEEKINDCFVIMPIADPEGYDKGHFKKVYEDIFKVACEKAGFRSVRADEVKQTNLIHLDILQKLIDSPIAICDLSNRNPNVLFELGLRQAFDKPTVLVQEIGTPKIFDISPLRYSEYRKELKYREVLEDQDFIATALRATKEATDKGEGVNSIISLLSLSSPASLKEVGEHDAAKMLQIVMSEMNDLRADFRKTLRRIDEKDLYTKDAALMNEMEYVRARTLHDHLRISIKKGAPVDVVKQVYDSLQNYCIKFLEGSQSLNRSRNVKELLAESETLMANYLTQEIKQD